MTDHEQRRLSRREFALRAAVLSVSASIAPANSMLPSSTLAASSFQLFQDLTKLSAEAQAEADSRYQLALSRHGSRLNEEEKRNVRMLCYFVQPSLDRLRSFSMKNGDVPSLYLRPLIEREKVAQSKHAVSPSAATPTKP